MYILLITLVLHSWKCHEPSSPAKKIKTNKTFNEATNGTPHHDAVFGIKTRVGTPIKTIITNEYGNKAEKELREMYANIVEEKNEPKRLITHVTPHFKVLKERNRLLRKASPTKQIPLYKSKLFRDVESKVKEDIKKFKTYGMKHNIKGNTGDQKVNNTHKE